MIEKFLTESRTDPNKQSRTSNPVSSIIKIDSKTIFDIYLKKKLISPSLSNPSDLYKSSSQISLMSCSQTFSELIPSTSIEIHISHPTKTDISESPIEYSMMEFALQNFKLPNKKTKKNWSQIEK